MLRPALVPSEGTLRGNLGIAEGIDGPVADLISSHTGIYLSCLRVDFSFLRKYFWGEARNCRKYRRTHHQPHLFAHRHLFF